MKSRMTCWLTAGLAIVCLSLAACGGGGGGHDGTGDGRKADGSGASAKSSGGGNKESAAGGFETPDAALDAYGKALEEGDYAAFRKIGAKDTQTLRGFEAIISLQKNMSHDEAAKINLQALAPMQGFGDAVARRFPTEIDGDQAVIVQLFEREFAFEKEIGYRKFLFTRSGGSWHLTSQEAGPASKLPAKYDWDNAPQSGATGAAEVSDPSGTSLVPVDALAAVVVHPRRAAESETGQALLALDAVQAGLAKSHVQPNDVERIIYAMGIPTEESESDCTIVQFAKPQSRTALLQEEFADLPYEEVRFAGATYYRYAHDTPDTGDTGDVAPPNAESTSPAATPEASSSVLARFPEDRQPSANGHSDGSDSGNWFYYSSQRPNPTLPEAELRELHWNGDKKRYEAPRGAMGNTYPAIGGSLDPSPRPPQFAVLRWKSRASAQVQIRGNFRKYSNAKTGDGVRALIFVDGEQEFAEDIRATDTIGADFAVAATVKPGSMVDFVIDPKGNSRYDSTKLAAVIELSDGSDIERIDTVDSGKRPEVPAGDDDSMLYGTAVYFPDATTMVSTSENWLRELLSGPPADTPLTKRLSQLDLDHDVVAIVALEGHQDQVAELLAALAEHTGSPELGGMSVVPRHAQFVTAALDLTGDTLLSVTVEAISEESASDVENGLDSMMEAVEGLRHVIPEESPLLPMLKQLVRGTSLQADGTQVALRVKMPAGLPDFVRTDATAAIKTIAEMSALPGAPGTSDSADGRTPPDGGATETVYRPPPKDHPEFRDLAVKSHDCRVFFPGEPDFSEQVVKISEGSVHVATFQGKTPRASYLFEIYTYPKAFVDKRGAEGLLKQTRDTLVDAPRGRLNSSEPTTYHDAPALDFVYEHPDTTGAGKGHCRVVIRGNRVYLLEVDGSKTPEDEIDVFHDSLAPYALPNGGLPGDDVPAVVEKPKLPLPDEAAREEALTLVRGQYEQQFQAAKARSEKVALAEEMIAHASEVEAAAERYVLLDVARKMAASAGGVEQALSAVERLDDEFDIDELPLLSEVLVDLAKAPLLNVDRLRVAQEMLSAAESATDADRYDLAVELLQESAASARTARDYELARQALERRDEADQLKTAYEAVEPALSALSADADDAAAHQTVGEFYCLMKGQWEKGLPHLVQGTDARLKSLAEQDLAAEKSTGQQVALADRWRELSETSDGLAEKQLQFRAGYWYRQALPALPDSEKDAIEKRLSEMKYVVAAAGPKIVFLPDLEVVSVEGVLINDDKGNFREERLKGEKYPMVLWAHPQDDAASHYAFKLNRKYSQLSGKAAINDIRSVERAAKPQVFSIYGDQRLLWKSRPLQERLDSQEFSVNVSNVRTLHLYVEGGGYGGHALWVDVVLEEKQ